MAHIEDLLAGLEAAARANEKAEFDRLERELLAHFERGFDGMPADVYQQYVDVDRHWPVAVDNPRARGRTLAIRLPLGDQLWLEELATATDRSLSSVISECLQAIRSSTRLKIDIRAQLERGRRPKVD
jgi:hypothetical protein